MDLKKLSLCRSNKGCSSQILGFFSWYWTGEWKGNILQYLLRGHSGIIPNNAIYQNQFTIKVFFITFASNYQCYGLKEWWYCCSKKKKSPKTTWKWIVLSSFNLLWRHFFDIKFVIRDPKLPEIQNYLSKKHVISKVALRMTKLKHAEYPKDSTPTRLGLVVFSWFHSTPGLKSLPLATYGAVSPYVMLLEHFIQSLYI